jgi:hypothetical protein
MQTQGNSSFACDAMLSLVFFNTIKFVLFIVALTLTLFNFVLFHV